MLDKVKIISNYLLYGSVGKDFYKENRQSLNNLNYTSVKWCYIFSIFVYSVLCISVLVFKVEKEKLSLYLMFLSFFVFTFLIYILYIRKIKKLTFIFYYLLAIVNFAFAIIIGTILTPNEQTMTFFIALIIIPLMYLTKPIYSFLLILISSFAFLIISFNYESADLIIREIMQLIETFVISNFFVFYIQNIRLATLKEKIHYEYQAKYDKSTGILNKGETEHLCKDYIENLPRNVRCALIIMDIDNFKIINDKYGHKIGDEVIKNISKALVKTFRKEDIVGRIGGDEFLVLMTNIKSDSEVEEKARKLEQSIGKCILKYTKEKSSCSIGVVIQKSSSSYKKLFEQADLYLYQAKEKGRGRYIIG